MRRYLFLFVPLILLAGCSSDSSGGESGPAEVTMTSSHLFDPDTLTVAPGTKITWTNDGDEPHTVTAYSDEVPEGEYFASGDLPDEDAARESVSKGFVQVGETYSVTLDTPGTYAYFCIPHENHGMTGEIVVEE
jgi:plastocyanin